MWASIRRFSSRVGFNCISASKVSEGSTPHSITGYRDDPYHPKLSLSLMSTAVKRDEFCIAWMTLASRRYVSPPFLKMRRALSTRAEEEGEEGEFGGGELPPGKVPSSLLAFFLCFFEGDSGSAEECVEEEEDDRDEGGAGKSAAVVRRREARTTITFVPSPRTFFILYTGENRFFGSGHSERGAAWTGTRGSFSS